MYRRKTGVENIVMIRTLMILERFSLPTKTIKYYNGITQKLLTTLLSLDE